jgi:tRNA (cytidine/uridine-2'-O-)-methyltransferase
MLNVVLYEPEIPPNTGNIMRLCANTGARLHLVEPLGFTLEEKLLRRAALDYRDFASVTVHPSFDALKASAGPARFIAVSTKGATRYDQFQYEDNDYLTFGPETRGLPEALMFSDAFSGVITIPMRAGSRSINLSNAAAIVLFEAFRQQDFNSFY